MRPTPHHPPPSSAGAPLRSPVGPGPGGSESWGTLFAGLFGLLLGLGLLKFGNPILLDHLIEMPKNADEWRVFSWPIRLGHAALALVTVVGAIFLASCRHRSLTLPRMLGILFAVWFVWQCLATFASTDPATSRRVLLHFGTLAACFFLGHACLPRVPELRVFWMCLVFAFLAVLVFAIEQRLGGLETTRKLILERPDSANLPPDYLARIRSNRVFATLVYPNALAGAILLLLPATAVLAAAWGSRWGPTGHRLLFFATSGLGLLVLVWSGSKAGWLIAMALLLLLFTESPLRPTLKIGGAALFLVLGLTAFGFVFREKLARGATSAAARLDYWNAAWQGFQERPLLGQGPGAFKRVYARVKRPESEMAQLAHNDYLQQATDSGAVGFLAYSGFIAGSLGWLYRERRRHRPSRTPNPLADAVGLGVLGWFAHGWVEFGLYIPATSWCAFALLGWLLAHNATPTTAPTPPPTHPAH